VVDDFRFEETAEEWKVLKERLGRHPDVAIETSSGAVVERLLEAGYAVYPVNPKAASVIEKGRCLAEPRQIISTPGRWPMPCGWTVMAGGR
jgi:hypothetical protein